MGVLAAGFLCLFKFSENFHIRILKSSTNGFVIGVLVEVYYDYIGYDKRIVREAKYQPCEALQAYWADTAEF